MSVGVGVDTLLWNLENIKPEKRIGEPKVESDKRYKFLALKFEVPLDYEKKQDDKQDDELIKTLSLHARVIYFGGWIVLTYLSFRRSWSAIKEVHTVVEVVAKDNGISADNLEEILKIEKLKANERPLYILLHDAIYAGGTGKLTDDVKTCKHVESKPLLGSKTT